MSATTGGVVLTPSGDLLLAKTLALLSLRCLRPAAKQVLFASFSRRDSTKMWCCGGAGEWVRALLIEGFVPEVCATFYHARVIDGRPSKAASLSKELIDVIIDGGKIGSANLIDVNERTPPCQALITVMDSRPFQWGGIRYDSDRAGMFCTVAAFKRGEFPNKEGMALLAIKGLNGESLGDEEDGSAALPPSLGVGMRPGFTRSSPCSHPAMGRDDCAAISASALCVRRRDLVMWCDRNAPTKTRNKRRVDEGIDDLTQGSEEGWEILQKDTIATNSKGRLIKYGPQPHAARCGVGTDSWTTLPITGAVDRGIFAQELAHPAIVRILEIIEGPLFWCVKIWVAYAIVYLGFLENEGPRLLWIPAVVGSIYVFQTLLMIINNSQDVAIVEKKVGIGGRTTLHGAVVPHGRGLHMISVWVAGTNSKTDVTEHVRGELKNTSLNDTRSVWPVYRTSRKDRSLWTVLKGRKCCDAFIPLLPNPLSICSKPYTGGVNGTAPRCMTTTPSSGEHATTTRLPRTGGVRATPPFADGGGRSIQSGGASTLVDDDERQE